MKKTNEKTSSDFVNAKIASQYFGIKEGHLRSLVFAKQVPFYKIGALTKFKLCELEETFRKEKSNEVNN
jgi:hypothetical protein